MASAGAREPSVHVGLGRDFWLFRIGQAISVVGDSCGTIALAWWILEATGSAVVMSSVLAPAMLVRTFLMPLFGPLGDRVARKTLIASSDLWRGGLMCLLAAMAWFGRFHLPSVIGVYVLIEIGTAAYGPTSTAVVPQLVTRENLPLAFQQTQAISSAGRILGGLVGGVLVSLLGVAGAFAVDAASFVVGAVTAQLIRSDTRPVGAGAVAAPGGAPASAAGRWMADLAGGFRFLYAVRLLFALALIAMVLNFVLAPLVIVLPVFVKEQRNLPAWYLGALQSGIGVGTIIGAALTGWFCRRLEPDRTVVFAIALMGVAVAAVPRAPGLVLPIGAILLAGVASALANIPIMSHFMAATPDAYRSRVQSIMLFLAQGAGPIGVALAGTLVAVAGLGPTMTAMGALTFLLAPVLLFIPRLSGFFRTAPNDAAGYLAAHYPRAFAGEPEPASALRPTVE